MNHPLKRLKIREREKLLNYSLNNYSIIQYALCN